MNLDFRIGEIYENFQGFPPNHNAVVRFGQRNDSFTILVFEILFRNYHKVTKFSRQENTDIELLKQYIVPPPDDSIDIFFEEIDVDENTYHVVQVKNTELVPSEIEAAFLLMENSISNYLKKPNNTRRQLKEIIADTEFSKQYKTSCIYYVVHKGTHNVIRNQRSNQKIISKEQLLLLEKGARLMSVPNHNFIIDSASNFIVNNFINQENTSTNTDLPQSILCNLNGYDLAVLNNKYSNTILGRNILYGLNLRESLSKSSKTFDKMFDTIDNEPDLFLFYNNGITILSSYFDTKPEENKTNKEKIIIENFSIINGAQTTSTLGEYLRQAELNNDSAKIEKLKKVFVLTKIYQINTNLKNHESISDSIKIYNNTQTPLSVRDLVSIRREQIELQEKLINKDSLPNLFMFIKKGEQVPSFPKFYPHQKITNEVLAQLSLCGFYSQPFNAKDKKLAIFENDNKEGVLLNSTYDKIFSQHKGILFQKSVNDIDELAFIYILHNETKKYLKDLYKNLITRISQSTPKNEFERDKLPQIENIRRNSEIANACLFYNITTYFEIKSMFGQETNNDLEVKRFDYSSYYENRNNYKNNLVKEFSNICFNLTIDVIRKSYDKENVVNWLRAEKNQGLYLESLSNELLSNAISLADKYPQFISSFKV